MYALEVELDLLVGIEVNSSCKHHYASCTCEQEYGSANIAM